MDARFRSILRVTRSHPGLAAVGVTLVLAIGVYLSAPDGYGAVVYLATGVVAAMSALIGPLVRRNRPRTAWLALSGGAACFVTDLLLRAVRGSGRGNFFLSPDTWTFAGYALMALTLLILLRSSGQAAADALLGTDAAVVTIGAALFFWSLQIGPNLHQPKNSTDLVISCAYPVFDALLLALAVHLLLRQDEKGPAVYGVLTAVSGLLIGDVAYVFAWNAHPGENVPMLNVFYLIGFVGIAVAGSHSSGWRLERHRVMIGSGLGRQINLSVSMLLPVVAAFLTTPSGRADLLVRGVLVGVLLGAVLARTLRTIRALERAERLTRHQACFDGLTGLGNRSAFLSELDLRLAAPGQQLVALLFLGGDRFKQINDTWGHPAGDTVLTHVARTIREISPEGAGVYRMGGDVFAVLMSPSGPDETQVLAERLLRVSLVPLKLENGQSVVMSNSIGSAQAIAGECTSTELLRNADIAMFRAKGNGRATAVAFDESLAKGVTDQALMVNDLRQAVKGRKIRPHFQPIKGGPDFTELVGFEALARWTHPDRGVVPPDKFIPVAEDTGMIVELGEQILRESCRQLAAWRKQTGLNLHISVNLSVIQIMRSNIPRLVLDVLTESGLPPAALWLELTESLLVDRSSTALETMLALKRIGVVLVLDDFGTGYSSLSYLSDFPLDIVKIDKAFVDRLPQDPKAVALTRTIIGMVAALGLTGVVAEGIETEAQATCLRAMGCGMGQGWLLGRPVAPDKMDFSGPPRPELQARVPAQLRRAEKLKIAI